MPTPTPEAALVALHRMADAWKLNASDISVVNDALIAAKEAPVPATAKTGERDAPLDFMNPEDLEALAEELSATLGVFLAAQSDGMDLFAEQYLALAMNHLNQTVAHLNLAALAQARGLADARMSSR